jgi:hypothetical protein
MLFNEDLSDFEMWRDLSGRICPVPSWQERETDNECHGEEE